MAVERDSTRPVKDCRKCNRRRIKCDRGLPGCQKCHSRSLECPGYGLALKWDQGIASRGRLKGLTSPAQETDPTRPSSASLEPFSTADDEYATQSSISKVSLPERSISERMREESLSIDGQEILLTQLRPPMPAALQHPFRRQLLHHYDRFIAPQLAWVDTLENPWRNIILPMAFESPSLLSTVLASAAGDLSSRYCGGTRPAEDSLYAFPYYHDQALALLTKNLHHCTFEVTDHRPATSVLASILLLCYYEMKWPDSGLWLLHLRAARTVINSSLTNHSTDSTWTFLKQEFFAINAMHVITKFDSIDELTYDDEPSDNNAIFFGFLRIIRNVTGIERRHLVDSHLGISLVTTSLANLHIDLAQAREHALDCCRALTFSSSQAERNFHHFVQIFYDSVFIYAHRALLEPAEATPLVMASCNTLFQHLRGLNMDPVVQEMAWPVFIAGTECCGNLENQTLVETKMTEIIKLNGALDRIKMLDFLKSFWKLQEDQRKSVSWIQIARERARNEDGFVVL